MFGIKKKQKLEKGMAVVYRLTQYTMVKTGTLFDRASTDKGWIVRDDGDGKLYILRDGVSKIRIPTPDQLKAYRKRVRERAGSGRLGVLPDKVMGFEEMEPVDILPAELEADTQREAGMAKTADEYGQGLFPTPSPEVRAKPKPKSKGDDVGGQIADAVHEELGKEGG